MLVVFIFNFIDNKIYYGKIENRKIKNELHFCL